MGVPRATSLGKMTYMYYPSIEDSTNSLDYDCEPVASGCTSELSESSDSSEHLNTPYDSDSDDSESSLSSLDQEHDCSLDETTSFSELSDEERELEGSQSTRKMLFPGAQFSNHEFSVALLSIFQKHSLTYSAVEDLLKLFHCVLPIPSALPTSQHMLLKEFVSYDTNTILHRCCGSCCQLLPSGKCSRRECQASSIKEATFVEVMIDAQLKKRFLGKSFYYTV